MVFDFRRGSVTDNGSACISQTTAQSRRCQTLKSLSSVSLWCVAICIDVWPKNEATICFRTHLIVETQWIRWLLEDFDGSWPLRRSLTAVCCDVYPTSCWQEEPNCQCLTYCTYCFSTVVRSNQSNIYCECLFFSQHFFCQPTFC